MISEEIKKYNNIQTGERKKICDVLAAEIIKTLPEAEYKIWHKNPVWFLGGNPVPGYAALKESIQLLFWSGQSFDENGLDTEGTFKAAQKRYLSVDEVDINDLARWLTKARDIQWDYKNIVKRKGKLERIK